MFKEKYNNLEHLKLVELIALILIKQAVYEVALTQAKIERLGSQLAREEKRSKC